MSDVTTASAIVRFTEELQDASARFYRELAATYPQHGAALEGYARRCERDKTQLVRTYRETVTDALETNYSFSGIAVPEELTRPVAPADDWDAAKAQAVALEEGAAAFYTTVAEQAAALLATIPRAYRRVATRRREQAAAWRALA
ncbi:MAG TPA: hypothetical protein GX714_06475 [Chloroflexi bacterium]|jgi:hypothetical protein|nr:hypothetical protein [Chloroflexota bacterium]